MLQISEGLPIFKEKLDLMEYFDYGLNKSEFSNGLNLRNRYIHDTNSVDES